MHLDMHALSVRPSGRKAAGSKSKATAPSAAGLILTALLAALLAPSALAGQAKQVLPNPGFEQLGEDGFPTGWGKGGLAPEMTWSIDTENKHSGKQSLKIVGNGVTQEYAGLTHAKLKLDGPATYRFSGWFKTEDFLTVPFGSRGKGVHAFWLWCKVGDTDQKLQSFSLASKEYGTNDWLYAQNEFEVPCPVTLVSGGWASFNGTLWYDDVKIELISTPPPTQTDRGPVVPELVSEFPDALIATDKSFAVLFAPPVKKITRRITAADGALSAGARTAVSLAKNEYEAVQLVVAPLGDEPLTVEFEATVLHHVEDGRQLPGAVTVQPVGYVGFSDGQKLITEPWPDPLYDEPNARVRPDELQPLWVEVHIPADAPAGRYLTSVRITHKRKPVAVVPIDVTVYDFALPSAPTLPTAMSSFGIPAQDQLFAHRIGATYTCHPMLSYPRFDMSWRTELEFDQVKPTVDETLARIEAVGGRHFNVEIPRFPGTFPGGANSIGAYQELICNYSKSQREYIVRYYRQYAQYLKDRGLFDMATVYLYDEPEPSAFDFIRDCRELIRQADPDLRCMVVGHLWPEMIGINDVWCPHVKDFDSPDQLEFAKRRQEMGEKVWTYSTTETLPHATWLVDPKHDLLSARLIFWIVRNYRLDGFLHWSSDRGMHPVVRLGNSTDCYLPKGSGAYAFGGGQLLYSRPVQKQMLDESNMRPDVMIPSIRIKAVRDGLEDHDYFVLLEQAVENADPNKTDPEALNRAKKLIDIPPDIVVSFTQYTHDAAAVLDWRDRVARAIEALGTDADQ